jgi:hypothetical protein
MNMNEREAIEYVMKELKEMRSHDSQMYWEMRNQTTKRYDELLNRLREIDERAIAKKHVEVKKMPTRDEIQARIKQRLQSRPMEDIIQEQRNVEKELPSPRFKESPQELRVDKYPVEKKEEKPKRVYSDKRYALAPVEDVKNAIEAFLKEKDDFLPIKPIKQHIEQKFNITYTNFNDIMTRSIKKSRHIKVDKTSKKFLYYYEE